jgi:hypothetical protein
MRHGFVLGLIAIFLFGLTAFAGQKKPTAGRPSAAAMERARREFRSGRIAEKKGEWTLAFSLYSLAEHNWPQNKSYRLRQALAKFHLVQARVYDAESDAAAGHLQVARQKLQVALTLEPTYGVARQRLMEIDQMLARRPSIESGSAPQVPELQPEPGKRTIDYRGDTEGAYQEIARQFGVAAAFDPQMPHQIIRFHVSGVSFFTAMRLLAEMTGTFWRPLTPRLFFVTANTPAKVREYAPSIVRTVLLGANQTQSGMENTARIVRSIAEIDRTQLDTTTHTLTLRGTPNKVALATALIHEIEQPRGELLLQLDILEVNRNLAQQIGITPPTSAQIYTISPTQIEEAQQSFAGLIDVITQIFGQPSAISGLPTSQVEALLGAGQLSAASLLPPLVAFGGGKTTFLATLPGAVAQLSETLNLVQSGQQMLLRAEDGEPATLFVGDRYPVTLASYSGSLTPPAVVPQVTSPNFPRSDYPVGSKPAAIASADFNGDGYPDLAVANEGDNTVSILLNDGSGSFTTGQVIPVPAGPVALVAGDFSGNGKQDLAVVSRDAGTVTVLGGNGDGTFSLLQEIHVAKDPVAIVSADFNGDGKPDLAVASSAANTVSILLGKGDGTFEGPLDLPVGSTPVALATGDFNGDGKIDLAVVDQGDNNVLILNGLGDGTFSRGGTFPTGTMPDAIVVTDLNGDGNTDLAVTNATANTVSILFGNGNGTFQPKIDYATGNDPVAIVAADFNLDGFPDLAVLNQTDNTVSIFVNSGTGSFGGRIDIQTGNTPDAMVTDDFDKDGRPDLAVANQADNTVSVILNNITLISGVPGALTPYPNFQFVDLGLKVTVTPRMHPDGSVTLKMKVQIRGLTPQDFNGIPVLTNRTIEQTARVKEGQPTMLVSFLQPQESLSLTGWPGFAALAARNRQNQKEELVIVVRPRLIRKPVRKSETFYAGIGLPQP